MLFLPIGYSCKDDNTGFYNFVRNILLKMSILEKSSIDSSYLAKNILSFNNRIEKIIQFYNYLILINKK